jgi:Ca-activated chloride channel homolog
MKLKTTAMLTLAGVLASAAGAFAIPMPRAGATADPDVGVGLPGDLGSPGGTFARATAGDTLMIDARLGHASLARGPRGETFLLAQVSASDAGSEGAPLAPMNLGIVIDRSGSMKGERIANAMNAAILAVERMRDGDSVSVVSFDTSATVVVPPTPISRDNRASIEARIRGIRLGGDTCISCGLEEGMRQISASPLGGDRVNRMILLSDGATNAGVRDVPGLRAMASRMHGRGVTISTIGVDVDFDEKVMAAIAQEANGRHHFVASASGLPSVFAQEFDDLLASVARDAELSIELAPGVEVAEVFDRSFRRESPSSSRSGSRVVVPFGTFSGKQEKTVLVRLRVPTDREGTQPVADVRLAYRDLVKRSDEACSVSLAVDLRDDGGEQHELDPFVAARLERSRTARVLTDANRLFEAGRLGDARAKLATRRDELRSTSARALALAPQAAAPARAAKPLDRDFADQLGAVAKAEQQFAPAPVAGGATFGETGPAGGGTGRFAPAPVATSREGKASVRTNQEAASSMGF